MEMLSTMTVLCNKLKIVLADVFAMHLKAWNYHWNIEGSDFSQYHAFFGEIYTELQDEIDPIAEHIRALGEYAPGSLSRYKELTTIEDELTIVPSNICVSRLLTDNNIVLSSMKIAYTAANDANEIGVSNYLQDRIDAHQKLGWKLKASHHTT